ncbi:murein biosynthesis integral membrane protein MurJ [Georgenia wangjunii]|uniref:murein biosynthesis integral membrane protein MurJ n=1 Tax=Georgenia wangjunii TaxID=3117730 RepID=UPI002F25F4B2
MSSTTGARGLAGSAAVMFSGTLVSRLLGLVRNVVLVAAIGVTGAANSFSVANKLPNVIYMLVAGGVLNAILVPQIVRAMKARDGGDEYVNRLLTLAGVALLGLTLLLTAGSTVLVTVYASELDPQWFALAVAFALWCIPQLFFYGMYTLLGQVLNARGIFGPYMWAPAVNNVVAIVGLVAYMIVFGPASTGAPEDPGAWTPLRISIIAGTATLGVATQALVLIRPLRRAGFRFRPVWGLRGSGLGTASRVAMWAFAALAVAQLGFVAISNLAAAASGAAVGRALTAVEGLPRIAAQAAATGGFVPGNAAWDNANFIYILPQSLITVSLVTALFTRMSTYAATKDLAGVRSDLSLGLRTIGVFTVFASAALAVVALPMVQAVLPTTTVDEARGIARVVVALLAGIAALGALTMIQRVYYAFEDTRFLFFLQLPMTAIVVVGCFAAMWLPEDWWLVGAGAANTLSNVVGSVVAYLALRRVLPSLDGARVLRTHVRLVLAAAPAALLGWGLLHLMGPMATAESMPVRILEALARVGLAGVLMTAVYLLLLRRLQVDELFTMVRPVGSVLARVGGRLPGAPGGALARLGRTLAQAGGVRTMSADGPRTRAAGTDVGSRALDGQGATQAATIARGTVLAGRYRLEDEITCTLPKSVCWRGRDQILDREVQATILTTAPPASAETLDAARRAALVNDPRLQRILDVGTQDGNAYIVADILTGPSLAELAGGGTFPVEQARAVVGEAASALEAARRRGVHHLALSPSSVHLTADGQVLLTGTGVEAAARGLDDANPLATAREDAVGLVRLLYFALTGRWPGDHAQVPAAPRTETGPRPPVELRADVPRDLDALCRTGLGPGTDGPRSPSEVIRELAPWRDINVDALTSDDGSWVGVAAAGSAAALGAAPSAAASGSGGAAGLAAAAVPGAPFARLVPPPADAEAGGPGGPQVTDGEDAGPADAAGPVNSADDDAPVRGAEADDATVAPRDEAVDGGPDDAAPASGALSPDAPDEAPVDVDGPSGDADGATRDTSHWAPRAPRAGAGTAPAFDRLLSDAEDTPAQTTARHGRGAGVVGALGAAAAGAAAATASVARTGAQTVRSSVTSGRARLGDATEARQASRDARAEEAWVETADGDAPVAEEVPFTERRIDPTPIVLLVATLLVILGGIWAFQTLTAEPGPRQTTGSPTAVETTAEPTPTATTPAAEPTTPPPPAPAAPPQIAAIAPLDPEGDGAENPELTSNAFDGDPESYWRSRSYVDPAYGMKSGIGLAITLAEETLVSEVRIDLMGNGGNVQIRATDPATPTEGTLLAEGPMGPGSTFALAEPTTTSTIVLWFTSLPVADSDGRNRLEVAEIGLG